MADEITCKTELSIANGTTNKIVATRTRRETQTATAPSPLQKATEETVPTAAENIPLGDITTAGEIYVYNMGPTNYLQIGFDVAGTFTPSGIRLEAGQDCRFPKDASVTLQWRANTAAVRAELGITAK
jgi:hypothetical protein